jgi:hypothetical protein
MWSRSKIMINEWIKDSTNWIKKYDVPLHRIFFILSRNFGIKPERNSNGKSPSWEADNRSADKETLIIL